MIRFECEKCGAVMQSPESLQGEPETCPACKAVNVVPFPVRFLWKSPPKGRKASLVGLGAVRFADGGVLLSSCRGKVVSYWWAAPLALASVLGLHIFQVGLGWQLTLAAPGFPAWLFLLYSVNSYLGRTTARIYPELSKLLLWGKGYVSILLPHGAWTTFKPSEELDWKLVVRLGELLPVEDHRGPRKSKLKLSPGTGRAS